MPVTQDTENALAEIAYSQLQQNWNELTPYSLGFQLVDSDETSGKEIGVLAFNIFEKYYYLVVCLRNGFLQPLNIMIDVENSKIFPLTEKSLQEIMKPSADKNVVKDLVPRGKYDQSFSRPNLYEYIRSPILSKIASTFHKKFLGRLATSEQRIKKAFARFMIEAPRELQTTILDEYPYLPEAVRHINFEKEAFVESPKLKFHEEPSPLLSSEQNSLIYKVGFALEDNRNVDELSKVFTATMVRAPEGFSCPTESGIYEVLQSDGNFKKMMVIIGPENVDQKNAYCEIGQAKNSRGSSNNEVYLIDPDTYECYCIGGDRLIAKVMHKFGDYKEVLKKVINIGKCRVDKSYILQCGKHFSCRFTTLAKTVNNNGLTTLKAQDMKGNIFRVIVMPGNDSGFDINKSDKELLVTADANLIPTKFAGENANLGTFQDLKNNLFDKGAVALQVIDNTLMETEAGRVIKKEALYKDLFKTLLTDYEMPAKEAAKMIVDGEERIVIKKATTISPHPTNYYDVRTGMLPSNPERIVNDIAIHKIIKDTSQSTPQADIALAQAAAATGDQDVLDTTLLSAILGSGTNPEYLKEDIPLFMETVDKLGRRLLSLQWGTEQYLENFNNDEFYELQQNISECFTKLYDIALTFKEQQGLMSYA